MILFPAIDLKDGNCVRLFQGDMDQATVYNLDPRSQARAFADAGFQWLHLVDLNGAIEGHPVNDKAVESILDEVSIPAQLGGGIRDLATIETWLAKGVNRVILGTAALEEPDLVKEACRKWPGCIVVGIDARDGYVAVAGWAKTSQVKALDLALRFEDAGVAAIVYTDISRDGAMMGLNIEATTDLAWALTTPVIASGGVSALSDLEELKQVEESGIEGVIVGRALYDGRINAAKALELLGRKSEDAGERR
ncbi:MAG TPA: 1-(5-phosphoribosyl)-5-[(5-phosphoribosylamino)methylideneamino]imidazole-4-carboxamide isomerase [Alphaproteobacteria bacterium]|nr:1-(5-phosphoribosyl)-5-[(5-phosphoribosylamino)methylideneamino]imidazole-4-carboxamide isomerase [Alphaproteobacteria bacterium]